jgi:hypothetical protein
MTNEGYAQLVSLFTICCDVAVYCGAGAACDLTNSNSSFGNFGLIGEGVGPLKYTGVVTATSPENSDTFTVDLSVPTVSISTAVYDNVSGILTAYTSIPHEFSVGMGITIVGLGFTCPFEPGIRYYPSGAYGYVFEAKTVAPGRYVDAGNLIFANKQEIKDKSLASIALYHPDFYFPGDAQTNSRSRYFDAYRLIQQNKQEIVDKSLAAVALNYDEYNTFYFPGDSETNARSRYFDAYRLIQKNKDVIVSIAWTNTYNVYPGVAVSEAKCKRDLGFFIDAVSTDVFTGGNNYSRDFTLQYFNNVGSPISNGLQGEEVESNYAFVQARELMKQAITNSLVGAAYSDLTITTGPATYNGGGPIYSNTDPLACADVRSNVDNLVGIITVTIGAGNTSSLPSINYGYFNQVGLGTTSSPGGFKCARDLGYLVDAVSTDVFTGGNKYSRDFTKFYFTGTNPTGIGSTEIEPSVYAFLALGDYSKKAITNQLNTKDVGISSGPATYGGPGIAITVYPSGNPDACADVQSNIDNLVGIVTVVIGTSNPNYLNSFSENLGTLPAGANKCYRDIGYAVDAIYKDVRDFTNKNSIEFVKAYFDNSGDPITNGLVGELSESVTAINAVRDYSKLAINNLLNVQNLSLAIDPVTGSNQDPLSCSNVRTFIDNLAGIITTGIGATVLTIPNVSMASTVFSVNVGVATQPHTYVGGGNAKINVVRPFDGQVVYFTELYYTVGKVIVGSAGTGYLTTPVVTITDPDTEFGVPAQAVANIATTGIIESIEMVSSGRGYTSPPTITISSPDIGINTATAIPVMVPTYYAITKSTLPSPSGICTITVNENVPYEVGVGTPVPFFKQSRVLASGHSLEYIGSGTDIAKALPLTGGVPIQENETDAKDGGLVVFTSTDQSGNFRIGDGVVVNQSTGTISGTFYSKSLFSTLTPFILALGGE